MNKSHRVPSNRCLSTVEVKSKVGSEAGRAAVLTCFHPATSPRNTHTHTHTHIYNPPAGSSSLSLH
ncbi:unnamed protein product [Tetraodon nigroviridis]|uniref:(spotted green pufferfish) hypothetical protein n=1 Tax=Tetraodon nigroviridis TaxID=99883 RepID=Q4RB44_TETNG|nr:unnamed protein product [Tetraodon nigroviridis]